MGPALRHDHNGVGGHHIRPRGRHADDLPIVIVKVETVLTPVMLVEKRLERAPKPRMMRMRNPKTSGRYVRLGCSR